MDIDNSDDSAVKAWGGARAQLRGQKGANGGHL